MNDESLTRGHLQEAMQCSVVLQGPVRRTGKGPRTGPDCNGSSRPTVPVLSIFLRKTGKDHGPKTGSGPVQDRTEMVGL